MKYPLLTSCILIFTLCSVTVSSQAQQDSMSQIAGQWIFNEDLSDVTDRQVEVALKAAGEKVKRRWFDRSTDRYRGGPPEQELYDHISYDQVLSIELLAPEYSFTYEAGYHRPVFTDNRRRSVSLNAIDDIQDFSFAHWEGDKLLVEARPRDGGFADEIYSLINEGTQLQVELYIKPRVFEVPIEITRIYDRKQ